MAFPLPSSLRRAVRLPLLLGTTCGHWWIWRAGRPPARLLGAELAWRRAMFSRWGKSALGILGFRIEVEGTPPAGPCLLVSNHHGYIDIAVLASQLGCTFVSMDEVEGWPLIGRIAKDLETLFVDRERPRDAPRVSAEVAARLRRGETVVLFPEGKAGDGSALRPFRSPLLDPAAREELPVSWVALSYSTSPPDPPAARAVSWVEEITFGTHALRLVGLARVEARIAFGEAPIQERDRKVLARRLEEAIAARLGHASGS